MKLKYYTLNYNRNSNKIEHFNIFDNFYVNDITIKEIKKYIRSSKKYKYESFNGIVLWGFDAFCEKLKSIIQSEEWCRYEYEISVGKCFEENVSNLEKWDCYMQCLPNIEMIARDVIFQYKNLIKKGSK